MCVGSLDHLKNWNLLESLIYLKACLKIVVFSWYARRSLPFVSRFTSILMLEDSQLRLLNNISLLSVYIYITIKKRNGENFHMVRHSYRKHLMKS
jgi:hypothetical protein